MIQHEKKIFFSRNVVFDETKHAIASKFTELQGVRRIEVDVSSDDVSLDSGSESESEPKQIQLSQQRCNHLLGDQ